MKSKAERIFNIFEKKIPKYYNSETIRLSQVQMAMDIAAFLDNKESKRIMFIEAPVGTGKSLGSLVPSLIEAPDFDSKKDKNSLKTALGQHFQGVKYFFECRYA